MTVVSETKEWAIGNHPSVVNIVPSLCAGDLAASFFRAPSPVGRTVVVRVHKGLFLEGFGKVLGTTTVLHAWTVRIVGATWSMYHIADHNDPGGALHI